MTDVERPKGKKYTERGVRREEGRVAGPGGDCSEIETKNRLRGAKKEGHGRKRNEQQSGKNWGTPSSERPGANSSRRVHLHRQSKKEEGLEG